MIWLCLSFAAQTVLALAPADQKAIDEVMAPKAVLNVGNPNAWFSAISAKVSAEDKLIDKLEMELRALASTSPSPAVAAPAAPALNPNIYADEAWKAKFLASMYRYCCSLRSYVSDISQAVPVQAPVTGETPPPAPAPAPVASPPSRPPVGAKAERELNEKQKERQKRRRERNQIEAERKRALKKSGETN